MRLILGLAARLMRDKLDQLRGDCSFINKPTNPTIIDPLNLNITNASLYKKIIKVEEVINYIFKCI